MSYETNPITNRLKISKGWKNPHFPTQALNYSREMLLWFKVYLFLKAYLSFQQIRLLACEIRISENNTKVLYLSVNKDRKEQKKNAKSKWRSKSFLYALKSPLTKVQTQDARFLLYQDFKSLKKISSLAVNSSQKKIISKAWVTKNRNASWVNFANLVSKTRNKFKSKQQNYSKQKKLGGALLLKSKNYTQKNQQNIKQTFWINKQRQIFSVSSKIQKEILFIEKILRVVPTFKFDQKPSELRVLLDNLTAQYEKKKIALVKLQRIYNFSFHNNIKLQGKLKNYDAKLTTKVRKQQIKAKVKLFWLSLKKQLVSLKKQSLFFENKPQYFLILKKKLWKTSRFCVPTNLKLRNTILSLYFLYGSKIKNQVQLLFPLKKKNSYWIKYMSQSFSSTQSGFKKSNSIKSILNKNTFLSKKVSTIFDSTPQTRRRLYYKTKFNSLVRNIWKRKLFSLTKTRIFTKKTKLFSWQALRLIRFKRKKLQKRYKSVFKKKKLRYRRRKKKFVKKGFQYRLPYRREYKSQLKLFTNWKLKYLIQDFIQKYFAVRVYVKLLWPLAEFKNLKFYRIIFPKKKSSKAQRIFLRAKIDKKRALLRKRYVFISQVTNHLSLKNPYKRQKKQKILLRKIKRTLKLPLKKSNSVLLLIKTRRSGLNKIKYINSERNLLFPLKKKFATYNVAPNTWTLKSPKKNAYLSHKLKMLQVQGQKRLHWAAKARFMSNLVTTLTLFAKYLDPQPLAEALAKVIGNTKKHVSALKLVETVLRTLNMKRGVGYRIGLTGRANGADKSHVMYLRKLNRNRPRQTFSKNVNFAMAQARATIGAFGIKIWVYY